MQELNIDSKIFEVCDGNEVQQKVHQELVYVIDLASMIYEKAQSVDVKELIDFAIEFATTGSVCNQQGEIKRALSSADCSWSLLNCTKALIKIDCDIALGMYDGLNQAAENIVHSVANPGETLTNIVKTFEVAGYCLGKVVHEIVTADDELAFTAPEYYEKLCQEKAEQIDAIITFLDYAAEKVQEASVRDIFREGTAFLVEGYATGKMLGSTGKFFKFAKNKVPEFAQKIATAAAKTSEAVAVTTEGIPVEPNALEKACHFFNNWMKKAGEKAVSTCREIMLPKVQTFEQARNKALKMIGDLGQGSKPHICKLKKSAAFDRVVGRVSADRKILWRLDYDPTKGMHIHVEDLRLGKGLKAKNYVIPFDGNEGTFKSLLKHLNR